MCYGGSVKKQTIAAIKAHQTMGTYKRPSYLNSGEKNKIRLYLADLIPYHARVLTMAGEIGKDARIFIETKNAHVSSIEHNLEIFKKQQNSLKDKNAVMYFGEINEILPFLEKHTTKFDLIFLDFCGPYDLKKETGIENAMKLLGKNGHLAFSFMLAREMTNTLINTKMVESLEGGIRDYMKDKMDSIKAAVHNISSELKIEFKLLNAIQYTNSNDEVKAVPMAFFTYRRG